MAVIDEKAGLSNEEAKALLSSVNKKDTNISIFSKIKDFIESKKSEKLLKTKDICKVLEGNQR